MENSELISGLIAKREEALNDIVVLKKQILVKRADLKAIESAIAVVTPSIAAAKRIATRHARSRYFTSGELSRRCQDALRNARPWRMDYCRGHRLDCNEG
jgi:hypothetical protein